MSLLDNIKGIRGDGDESPGGAFNPFRLLEIGEVMVRYTDGIRIKDFVFLAILTSERLVLIDSAKQGSGVISKEIPVSVIRQADLEQDERGRPTLALAMEIGGQKRVMRLIFTGRISEPDTECREWYTVINGYPPELPQSPEPETVAPIIEAPEIPEKSPEPVEIAEPPLPVQEKEPEPIPQPPVAEEREEIPVMPAVPEPKKEEKVPAPGMHPGIPPARRIREKPVPQEEPGEGTIQIFIERPDIRPIHVSPSLSGADRMGVPSRYCIHCGGRISSSGKFCPLCGKQQS